MFCPIFAFAVLIVPVPTEFLVYRPVLPLALYALKTTRRHRKRRISWMIGAYRNTRSLCTLNTCVTSRRDLLGLCRRFCSGGGLSWPTGGWRRKRGEAAQEHEICPGVLVNDGDRSLRRRHNCRRSFTCTQGVGEAVELPTKPMVVL